MAERRKKRPYAGTGVFGIISLSSYTALFSNQEIVTGMTTEGGAYAVIPLLAAFYFSFIHGAFASNVLSLLGIEAKKKK